MSNLVLGFPNHIDSTYYTTQLFGGNWTLALTYLQNEKLAKVARSNGVTTAASQFQVDTGVLRQCRLWAVPQHNLSRTAQARIRATSTIKWSGVTVSGAHLAGDNTILMAAASSVTLNASDYCLIGGQQYSVVSTINITGGGTNTVTISPALVANASGGAAVTCIVGDYTAPEIDSGWFDVWQRIYPFGSLPFGHPSFWDGLPTDEDIADMTYPVFYLADASQNVRYHWLEFNDTSNTTGGVDLARLLITPGWQPSVNASYGLEVGYEHSVTTDESLGGVEGIERRAEKRVIKFVLDNVPFDEGIVQGLDIHKKMGMDKQLFYIQDPEDAGNRARLSMLCTMKQLPPIQMSIFDHTVVPIEIKEVV